jgi:tetratricopeptide (TPR) repeat protein
VIRTAHQLAGGLLGTEAIAGEAHLRFAYLSLLLGDRTGGLEHLVQAEVLLTDPVLLYAARVYGGSARERLNQPAEAIAAYRRALDGSPGARTAGLPLTSLLMRESRASEASAVAAQVLSNPRAVDPIVEYRRGDYRFVVSYLDQLKRVLP